MSFWEKRKSFSNISTDYIMFGPLLVEKQIIILVNSIIVKCNLMDATIAQLGR